MMKSFFFLAATLAAFAALGEEFNWDGRSSSPQKIWSSTALSVTPGETVRFDIDWLKREWTFGASAKLVLKWENAVGKMLGDTRAVWSNVKGCRNYELFEETTESRIGVPIVWSTYHKIPANAVRVRIGFAFGGNPCRVELLKGTVTKIDSATRPWLTKASGGERIAYGPSPFTDADVDAALKTRPRAFPKLVRDGDRVELEVNGERVYPAIRHSIKGADMAGVREFAKAGFRIQNVVILVGEPTYPNEKESPVLREDGTFDIDYIERKVRQVLREDKDAYVMLVCKISPTAAWKRQNTSELEQNTNGEYRVFATWRFSDDYSKTYPDKPGFGPIPSVFSEKYPKDVAASFAEAMRQFEKRAVSKAVIGAFVTGGDDSQFRLQMDPWTSGLAEPAFQGFLREKYGSDAALARAWKLPGTTLSNAKVPTEAEMLPEAEFVSDGPSPMSDFREFCSRACVRMNSAFRGAVKAGAPRLLTGGYTCAMTLTGLEGRGRHAMAELLTDTNTDFVVWLPNYTRRRDEITAPLGMWAYNGSMLLHKKLLVTELDIRYPHAGHFGFPLYDTTLWQASHDDRTFSDFVTYASAMAFAWGGTFHAYPLDNRWFDFNGAMKAWARAVETTKNAWGQSLSPDRIAVFYDDRATDFNSYAQKNVCTPAARTLQTGDALWRTGLRFDNYLIEDILTDAFAAVAPRVILINDATTLTPKKINAIRRRYAKDGRVLLWVGAPGLHSGYAASEISTALGFDVSRTAFRRPIVTSSAGDPLTSGLKRYWFESTVGFDTVHPTGWAIAVTNGVTPLAYYEGTQTCGAAVRRLAKGTEILIGAPGSVTPQLLRNVCRAAGIRPVLESDDFFVTGGHLMVIGASTRDGKRRINLPRGIRTLRSITGQPVRMIGKGVAEVELSCGSVGIFSMVEALDPQTNRPDLTCYLPQQPYVEMGRDRAVLDPTRRGDSYNDHFQVLVDERRSRLHAFWTQASWEGAEDQHIAYSQSDDDGRTWTAPQVLAGSETRAVPRHRASWQQPMLAKSGRLYCLWNQQTTDRPPHCGELYGRFSDNGGETWSEPERVPFTQRMDADPADSSIPPSWCNWQRPLRLGEGGRFLVGCSRHGKAAYDDRFGCKVEFWQFDNLDEIATLRNLKISYFATNRKAFSAASLEGLGGFRASEPAIEEAGLVKLPDGRLFALMRSSVGSPVWAQSRDGGRTWSEPKILRAADGRPFLHPRSPCPIYDWKGCEAASGMYFALIHNTFDFENAKGNAYQPRGPLYLIAGHFDPNGEQPLRFSAPKLFAPRPLGNSFYTSYTVKDGEGILWFNDCKHFLLGRRIDPEWVTEDLRGAAPYRLITQKGAVDRQTLVPDFIVEPSGVSARAWRFDRLERGENESVSWAVFLERETGRKFLVYRANDEGASKSRVETIRAIAERHGAVVVGSGAPLARATADAQQNSPEWDLRPTALRLRYDPAQIVPYEFRIDAPRKTPMATDKAAHIFDFSLGPSDAAAPDAWDPYVPVRVAAGEFDRVDAAEVTYVPTAGKTPIQTIAETGMTLLWLRRRYPEKTIVLQPCESFSADFSRVVNKELRKFAALGNVKLADFPELGGVRGAARTESFSSTRGPWWWFYRMAQKNRQISRMGGQVDLAMVGDSITHFWEGCAYWTSGRPVYRALQRQCSVLNLGYGGDQTQNALWRLLNGELDGYRAKCVALMIGTNDRGPAEDVAKGIREILRVIRDKQPSATVLLQSILPRGGPDNPLRARNAKVNELIEKMADGQHIVWCDLTDRFLNPDGTIVEGLMTYEPDPKTGALYRLHPHRQGYEVWRQAILPLVQRTLAATPSSAASRPTVWRRERRGEASVISRLPPAPRP